MGSFISWLTSNEDNSNQGSAQSSSSSLSGLVTTLIPVLVLSGVYLAFFLVFRRSQRRYYAPRTYLGSLRENNRTPELPGGFFNWFPAFWKIPDVFALQHQSLDAYLFLRYLRTCTVICFVSACITWPILFPINATGGGGQSELNILSYTNIDIDTESDRFYAHTFVGWAVYGFLMYMITRECIFYITLRQAYLLSPQYAKRISARTVLFTCVPDAYLEEERIRTIFSDSVKNVWIAGETKELDDLVEERDKIAMKLEKGEIKLLKTVTKERMKALKKSGKSGEAPTNGETATNGADNSVAPRDPEAGNVYSQWITDKQRPTHKLGPLGLIGQKVDTIEWSRTELAKLIPKTEAAQLEYRAGKFKKVNAVFVEFNTQSEAQAAFQVVTHHQALHMSPKYIGVRPDEVVWKSLTIPWWQLVIRRYAVYGFIAVLVIFWAIPVGIVGLISQVSFLETIPGLTWLSDIPSIVLGFVSGLLPSVALAILMSFVPVIMRLCARLAGATSLSQAEMFTQNAYFFFQVVQVFLITTMFSSASAAITQIAENPADVFNILASTLPTSSNFYISYFIVQGLSISINVLTQVIGLFIFRILYKFLATTPRAMYTKWTSLVGNSWGSLLPVYTNIAVISVTYSVIAPLILGFSSIGMGLFYLAFRYNILFVSDTAVDTAGLIYPRALKQLFTGIYLSVICMIGLFACSKAIGPAVLMGVFLAFIILFQISLSKALDPLLYGLPRSLSVEEELIQARPTISDPEASGDSGNNGEKKGIKAIKSFLPGSDGTGVQKNGNWFLRWLKPWVYSDYEALRKMVPQHETEGFFNYNDEIEADAYWPPSVTAAAPVLWIPEDSLGVSKQEITESSKVIPISDEGCTLDEKNKLSWDEEGARPPIWSEKVVY